MVWARLDDEILDNEKIARAGVLGFALHVAAITWCCRNLTDGFVPDSRVACLLDFCHMADEWLINGTDKPAAIGDGFLEGAYDLGEPRAALLAGHLASCGLWHRDDAKCGYWINDFLTYNPSKAEVLAERSARSNAKSEAGKKGAAARWARRPLDGRADGKTDGKHKSANSKPMAGAWHGDGPVPVPLTELPDGNSVESAREDPPDEDTGIRERPRTRGERCPDSTSPEAAAWCSERGIPAPSANEQVARMLDHFAAKPGKDGVKANWEATWRNWERRAPEFDRARSPPRREILQQAPPGESLWERNMRKREAGQ